jgi:hypothetical protein
VAEVEPEIGKTDKEEELDTTWMVPPYQPFQKGKVKLPHVRFNTNNPFPIEFIGHLPDLGTITMADNK